MQLVQCSFGDYIRIKDDAERQLMQMEIRNKIQNYVHEYIVTMEQRQTKISLYYHPYMTPER